MENNNEESKGLLLGFLGILIFSLTLPATRFITPYLVIAISRKMPITIFKGELLS